MLWFAIIASQQPLMRHWYNYLSGIVILMKGMACCETTVIHCWHVSTFSIIKACFVCSVCLVEETVTELTGYAEHADGDVWPTAVLDD